MASRSRLPRERFAACFTADCQPVSVAERTSQQERLLHSQRCGRCTTHCRSAEIPFYAIDFQEEFGRIMDYFVEEYVSGARRTPV